MWLYNCLATVACPHLEYYLHTPHPCALEHTLLRVHMNYRSRKFSSFSPPALIGEIFILQIFVLCQWLYKAYNDLYHMDENKIYSTEYFCNAKVHVVGLGEIFVQQKFSAVQYICSCYTYMCAHSQYPSGASRGVWAPTGEQASILLPRELLEEI